MSDLFSVHTKTYATEERLPQTKGFPLIGSLPALLRGSFDYLVQARETYGDIYLLNLGVSNIVMLNHPRHAEHVLVDNVQNYSKGGPLWEGARAFLGNGLVVSEGDFWLRQRRMMQPHFHRQRMAGLIDLMIDAINDELVTWGTSPNFDMMKGFSHITMRVMLRTMLGGSLTRNEMDHVAEAANCMIDSMAQALITRNLPEWMPVPGRKRFRESLATFDATIARIIAECRVEGGDANHLLGMLVAAVDDITEERMTDQQLRDEAATLFLGGYETSSLALTWTFHYLTQHPDVMERLQAEVDLILWDRLPTFADLPKLEYARMVFQEALRLRPSVWWEPRTAVEDDRIDGYHIPAGTTVAVANYMIHRHPTEWADPERFDPERFNPAQASRRHKYAWMPFGAGQRMCIGRDFAMVEGLLAMVMVLQRYRVARGDGPPAQLKLGTSLKPKGGMIVKLAKRDS